MAQLTFAKESVEKEAPSWSGTREKEKIKRVEEKLRAGKGRSGR
jgi:hypothetical protein